MDEMNGKDLGLLPTQGVGSYASTGWLSSAKRAFKAGEAGPPDLGGAIQDAVRIAVADQEEVGLDILTDGEIGRQRFLWKVVERFEGLKLIPPAGVTIKYGERHE